MQPEGVVNALSRIHQAVKKGGILLDLHPTRPFATVEAGGVSLGSLDEEEFMQLVAETEEKLEETVAMGLFAFEDAITIGVRERFDYPDELVEKVDADWFGVSVPDSVAHAVRAGGAPFEIRERVLLQRFRVR
jgi:hypothetical protein